MNISYQEKPKQQPRSLGRDVNSWPDKSGTIWRVVKTLEATGKEDFNEGDLLLILYTQYKGFAVLNLRSQKIYCHEIRDGSSVQIVQDFTVDSVVLFVDNSARP